MKKTLNVFIHLMFFYFTFKIYNFYFVGNFSIASKTPSEEFVAPDIVSTSPLEQYKFGIKSLSTDENISSVSELFSTTL